MNESEGSLERALHELVRRLGGRGTAVVSIAMYFGVGIIFPLAIGAGPILFAATNVSSVAVAGLLVLMWLYDAKVAGDRRHLLDWTTDGDI